MFNRKQIKAKQDDSSDANNPSETKKEAPKLRGGGLEETVLRAVMHLRGDGYGVTIRDEVQRARAEELTYGGIYTSLDRLEEKGFVESRWGEATPERGGRRKQYFTITGAGERALQEVEQAQARMRAALPWNGPVTEGGAA